MGVSLLPREEFVPSSTSNLCKSVLDELESVEREERDEMAIIADRYRGIREMKKVIENMSTVKKRQRYTEKRLKTTYSTSHLQGYGNLANMRDLKANEYVKKQIQRDREKYLRQKMISLWSSSATVKKIQTMNRHPL